MRTRSPSPGGGHQTRVSVASVSTTGRASKSANNTFDTSIGGGGLSALGNMNGAGSGRSEDEDYYDKISVGRASMESGRGGRGRQVGFLSFFERYFDLMRADWLIIVVGERRSR
jgi:hypothetical protein